MKQHFTDKLSNVIAQDKSIKQETKNKLLSKMINLKKTKVNILVTGATGCGKSSTINALFNAEEAKVGQGVDPQTTDITEYKFDNIILFDSPGLGDGRETDLHHARNITNKLHEKDSKNNQLIDFVLVVLDGSSRDLGTSFELINNVILPNIGNDKSRLLVAINQADMAMKGRYWNKEANKPEPQLVDFLNEKASSTKRRIFEASNVEIEPIYYSAGYKLGDEAQKPYNLSKLLLYILQGVDKSKRAVFIQDLNTDSTMWKDDDGLDKYKEQVQQTLWESIKTTAESCGDIGGELGSYFGTNGKAAGRAIGTVVGSVIGFFKGIFD